jgi:GTP-binding protein Era
MLIARRMPTATQDQYLYQLLTSREAAITPTMPSRQTSLEHEVPRNGLPCNRARGPVFDPAVILKQEISRKPVALTQSPKGLQREPGFSEQRQFDTQIPLLDSARASPHNRTSMNNQPPAGHRSGYVAVLGRPNVGKSTLINRYLGQNVAPVSPRAQTTIRRQLGILTLPDAQLIFVDTPGIHKPQHKLGERMNITAQDALADADVLLVIFDLGQRPTQDDKRVIQYILENQSQAPILCALNKLDTVEAQDLEARIEAFEDLLPEAEKISISATRGDNCEALLKRLIEMLPEGPRYYPEDEITDAYERDIAADMIRAACLQLLREEVPYCIAIRIDEFKERNDHGAYIRATLMVERQSQKGIVIGRNGSMLREIGTLARKEIEAMSGRKVYLDLKVSVLPRWRNDEKALKRFGYFKPKA